MASHKKSALSLLLLGQLLPPPPAHLTPQIRRLDCTWWRCKSTHHEASWRLVSSYVDGKGFAEVGQGLERSQVLLTPLLSCAIPSVPQRQANAGIAQRPSLTHTSHNMQSLGKAAGDSPRSSPAAAPFETNHCHLTNHLPQMWQDRSLGCFSHKFLPNSLSGFPRQVKAITALQTSSYYPQQLCSSAWGRLQNIPKAEECKIPKNGYSGPVILRN